MEQFDIDNIITPYADSQQRPVSAYSNTIHRIPRLVDEAGMLPEFQTFYDQVIEGVLSAILSGKTEALYALTNGTLTIYELAARLVDSWESHLNKWGNADELNRGIDIELNMDRFQSLHRNLIGGFHILTYHIDIKDDTFGGGKISELVQAKTELLFTYSNNKFEILNIIEPFTLEVRS